MAALRIGLLTGGGDCPGLNAAIRAITRHAVATFGMEVIGIEDGFRGLRERRYRRLGVDDVRGLLARGGTILGATNRSDPFRYPVARADGRGDEARDVSAQVLGHLAELELAALIAVGGDGTLEIARRLAERGARIVGVPKSIDDDVRGTDATLGYQTAVEIATEAVDRLTTTAESHDRVLLCEVMGRSSGWIALGAGLASGAEVILVPELPYRVERVLAAIRRRRARGIPFSVIVVAEGAAPAGEAPPLRRAADATQDERLGGAAERLARALGRDLAEHELRVTVLGHVQRGGPPCAYDRLLATRLGVAAVELAAQGRHGHVVTLEGSHLGVTTLKEATRRPRRVDPNGDLVHAARATGVELGA